MTQIDLDAVAEYVQERVWPAYEAAEDWQAANEHTCDPRCAAVEEIPDLTSDTSVLVTELRLHDLAVRELLEWARRSHRGDPALRAEEFYRATEFAQRVLDGQEEAAALATPPGRGYDTAGLLEAAVNHINERLNKLPWTGTGVDPGKVDKTELVLVLEHVASVLDPEDLGLKPGAPSRLARLEALADALAASDPAALNSREDGVCALCRAEDNDGSGQYVDLADPAVHKAHCPWRTAKALAARGDAGQEAPGG